MKLGAQDAIQRVLRAQRAQRTTHDELVRCLSAALKPGGSVRWVHVRRALFLAGHGRAKSHAIALAIYEAFPDARLSREGTRQRGPRNVVGVSLASSLADMRRQLAAKWEAIMEHEGMPAELPGIATEYTTPLLRNEHGDDGRAENQHTPNRLEKLVKAVHARKEWAGHYYGKATDYLWSCNWSEFPDVHRDIWALHCEGATRQEIAIELGIGERVVRTRIDYHRARAGLVHQ